MVQLYHRHLSSGELTKKNAKQKDGYGLGQNQTFENGIGITGGTGSGKSTVAKILRDKGYFVGDADVYARRAIEPGSTGLAEVRSRFGSDVFIGNALDRKKLGRVIYENPEAKKQLENIVHPLIQKLLLDDIEKTPPEATWFYDAALLFEAKTNHHFREVWVVARSDALRRASIMQRDGISAEVAQKRIDTQMPQAQKVDLADRVIWNDGSIADLVSKVENCIEISCIQRT